MTPIHVICCHISLWSLTKQESRGLPAGRTSDFFRVLRLGGDVEAIRSAAERLRKTVDEIEPLAKDPGDAWKDLTPDQRRGYLRVLSHLGTADHEIKVATQQIQQRTAVNS